MANVIGLSQEYEDNLRKLATYLLEGNLKAKFDMQMYSDSVFPWGMVSETDCGTIGCAVGHGPHAGIKKLPTESWLDYSSRVFGLSKLSDEWTWCFSQDWYKTDNTSDGAAQRIIYLLDNGMPKDFLDQMVGSGTLCYI